MMAEQYSDEWFAMVLEEAEGLPSVDGLSFIFDAEVTETPLGKVRAHGRVVDGRLHALASGKFVPASDGETVDVTFGAKGKRLAPVLDGTVSPLMAYMRGELKVDGAYELVLDHLANQGDRAALDGFRQRVHDRTDG